MTQAVRTITEGVSPLTADYTSRELARVLSVYHGMAARWRQFRLNCREASWKYHQHHWTSIPEEGGYHVTLPMEALVVDTGLAMITSGDPLLTVFPLGEEPTDRAVSDADRVEKWHLGVDYAQARQNGEHAKQKALFNALLYGLGWVREVAAFPDDWQEKPEDTDLHYSFPVIQQSLHPAQLCFRWGRAPGGITHLTYEGLYTVEEIEGEWGVRLRQPLDAKGKFLPKNPLEMRKVVEFWEWTQQAIGRGHYRPALQHCVFVTGTVGPNAVPDPYRGLTMGNTSYNPSADSPMTVPEWIKRPTEMPEYRRIPYYKVSCYETSEEKPDERFLSFLFKLREIPHLVEILMSRHMRIIEMYTDPMIRAKSGSGVALQIEKVPGAIIDMGPEDSVDYLTYPGTAPDLAGARDILLQMGYLSSFSPSVFSGQESGDSALAKTMDVEQSLFKIAAPTRHYKEALEDLYWHRTQLMKAFSPATPVPTEGEDGVGRPFLVRQTGQQLAKHAMVHVRIRPGFYSRLLADINVATQAVNAGVWDMEMAQDFLGVQDKTAVRKGRKRDMIEFSPAVLQAEEQVYVQAMMKEIAGDQPAGTPGSLGVPPGMEGGEGAAGALTGAAGNAAGTPGQEPGASGMQPVVQGIGNTLSGMQAGGPPSAAGGVPSAPLTPEQLKAMQLRRLMGNG